MAKIFFQREAGRSKRANHEGPGMKVFNNNHNGKNMPWKESFDEGSREYGKMKI